MPLNEERVRKVLVCPRRGVKIFVAKLIESCVGPERMLQKRAGRYHTRFWFEDFTKGRKFRRDFGTNLAVARRKKPLTKKQCTELEFFFRVAIEQIDKSRTESLNA